MLKCVRLPFLRSSLLIPSRLQKKAELELARQREAEKASRSYALLDAPDENYDEDNVKPKYSSIKEMEDDFM